MCCLVEQKCVDNLEAKVLTDAEGLACSEYRDTESRCAAEVCWT